MTARVFLPIEEAAETRSGAGDPVRITLVRTHTGGGRAMTDRPNGEDLVAQLERLVKLRGDGVLSEAEFATLKAKLVSGSDGQPLDGEGGHDASHAAPESAGVSEASSSAQSSHVLPITIGWVIGLSWSVIAGISAVVLLFEGAFGAAAFMSASAVVAAPVANAYAAARLGFSISGGLRIVIAIVALGISGYLLKDSMGTISSPSAGQSSDSSSPSNQNVAANSADLSVPADEAKFIAAVTSARDAYHAAANEMAQGGTRAARRAAICQALANAPAATGWIGTIQSLSSNTEGKGVLTISLAPDVSVGTWNNELSDIGDDTLLASNSPVFVAASAMKEGDAVRFSGSFIASDVDCTKEQSLTLQGSMEEPAFVFKFASVASPSSSAPAAESDSAQAPAQNESQPVQSAGNEIAPGDAPGDGDPSQSKTQASEPAVPAIGSEAMTSRFGNTLISRSGNVEWHMHFKSDGTFDGSEIHSNYSATGTWTVADSQLCIRFEPPIPGASPSDCQPLVARQIGDTWTMEGKEITLVQGIR